MKLYFSRNPNPRLAVATALHLGAPVTYEFAAPLDPEHTPHFLPLNPNLQLPILEEDGRGLWEADAIACRLSYLTGSDFWASDMRQPEMIRWLSWGKANFVFACDMVHFELGTKLRFGLGATDAKLLEEGIARFHEAAAILDGHLAAHEWLANDTLSYADFRMGTFLPYRSVMRLPFDRYPAISRWMGQLEAIPAWRHPFDGLAAPELPPIP